MALSDCIHCWETPCTCGYDYRNYPMDELIKMRDLFQRLIDEKTNVNKDYTVFEVRCGCE